MSASAWKRAPPLPQPHCPCFTRSSSPHSGAVWRSPMIFRLIILETPVSFSRATKATLSESVLQNFDLTQEACRVRMPKCSLLWLFESRGTRRNPACRRCYTEREVQRRTGSLGHPSYTAYQRTNLRAELTLTQTAHLTPLCIIRGPVGERMMLLPSACPAPNPKTFLKLHPKPKCQASERDRWRCWRAEIEKEKLIMS